MHVPSARACLVTGRSCALLVILVLTAPSGTRAETHEPAIVGPSVDLTDGGAYFLPQYLAARRMSPGGPGALSGGPGADFDLGGWNEPTIAVNPTNPLNIAYASLFELRVTTDGGSTWQPPVPIEVPNQFARQGDPGLAFDRDGRLFWSFLGSPIASHLNFAGIDVFIAQCNPTTGAILPGYPINVTQQAGVHGSSGNNNDKSWLAVDSFAGSPFANRLYLVWTRFPPVGDEVTLISRSSDQGMNWSPALQLGGAGTGSQFVWPSHVAVAPNGDVFAADHRQPGFSGSAPNGVSGFVNVFRSTDGGVSFPQVTAAFAAGASDMTYNVQTATGAIPGAKFWLQGSLQPFVLTDPNQPGHIYVVANDDPDNNVTLGDPANVYIVKSTNSGLTWSAPQRVDQGPGTSLQVMPTASIDPYSGAIVVTYYDNRSGAVNSQGNYLLDVFAAVSLDGGTTFAPDFQINDVPFDPDAGARCRFGCGPLLTDVWAGTGGQAVAVGVSALLSYNGTWSLVTNLGVPMWGIWGSSNSNIFMCGSSGNIFHYDGIQVTGQISSTVNNLFGIDGRSASDIFAVGALGTVVRRSGGVWSTISPSTSNDFHDVWANPTGSVFAVGEAGTVFRYDGTWTDISIPNADLLWGVWGSSDSDVYASSPRLVYHWNGSSWTPVDLGLTIQTSLWGSSATDVILLGFGILRRYNGTSWIEQDVSEHFLWKSHGTAASNVFAVGEDAVIARFDGSSWSRQNNPLTPVNPTKRIGEYNGVASGGGRSFAVWCGNTMVDGSPHDQQSIVDWFRTSWQTGVTLYDPTRHSASLVLESPAPNPTHGPVTVSYTLPASATVDLGIFDVQGRRMATLIRGVQPSGRHVVSWSPRDVAGMSAGIYLLRLSDGREIRSRRVSVMEGASPSR